MITIKDMSKMIGVSTTTISNVINGKTKEVSPQTIEKVRKLLDECNYAPNLNAVNLAQNQSKIIGVAIKGNRYKYSNMLIDPFTSELVGAIETSVRNHQYFMMLYISPFIEEIIQHVSSWNADGLILLGMQCDDYLKVKNRYKKPAVLIDSYLPDDVIRHVNVGLQDEQGGYLVAKYLLDNGHQRIGFVADNMEGVDFYRFLGMKRAFLEANVPLSEENLMIISPGTIEKKDVLHEFYEKASHMTAYMFCSDYYAATVLNYLQDNGLQVPEDISVTGFDNNLFSKIVRPMLTTVSQDVTLKAQKAVSCLMNIIEKKDIETLNIKFPVELIIRDSVKYM